MSTKNNSGVIFSDRVRSLMREKSVNQKALAEGVGLTQGMISKWLNGAIPKGDKLSALAQFFEVSVDELLTGQPTNYEGRGKAFGERVEKAKQILASIDAPPNIKDTIFNGLMLLLTKEDVTAEASKEREKRHAVMVKMAKLHDQLGALIAELGKDA